MKMAQICRQASRFWQDEAGLELSEYAVASALISLAAVSAFTALGSKIRGAIEGLGSKLTT